MFSFLAARMAVRRRGLELASPPPMRAAMVISRITRVKTRPRFASVAAFLCLMVAHFECPDMTLPLSVFRDRSWPASSVFATRIWPESTSLKFRPPGALPVALWLRADHDAETYQ